MKKFRSLSYKNQRYVTGIIFVFPWLLGFLFFFMKPIIQTIYNSFFHLSVQPNGGMESFFVGFKKYQEALTLDPNFNRVLTESVLHTLIDVPVIIIFSLFVAVLLNDNFRGRGLARSIFFLPVIITSGAVSRIISGGGGSLGAQMIFQVMESAGEKSLFLTSTLLEDLLVSMRTPMWFMNFITDAVDAIYEIISYSGVQILIFLAALQSIPGYLYESAQMEGATAYEIFWKITFPVVSPLILTNTVYSLADSFIRTDITDFIKDTAFLINDFGLSSAMALMYTFILGLIIAISIFLISKGVFYND